MFDGIAASGRADRVGHTEPASGRLRDRPPLLAMLIVSMVALAVVAVLLTWAPGVTAPYQQVGVLF